MKECKYGRIPPRYGSLEFAIYEAAKSVNDEWKRSRARHIKMIDKLRAKLMEGGFLDDTHDKVYGLNKHMCDMRVRIADKLAKDVVESARTPDWAKNMLAGVPEQLSRAEYEILEEMLKEKNRLMEEKKTKKMTKAEAFEWFNLHEYEEIGVDDILSIEIVENEFCYDKAVELAKPLMHYLNEVGFRDSIRVSQYGIVHEPMSTLIFDNGIGEGTSNNKR